MRPKKAALFLAAIIFITGAFVGACLNAAAALSQIQATPPPMPTEPPALLIGVADDVDIHVFNDHENRNTCYITTNRLHATAGGITCVPMAYRDLEDDDVPHR